MNIILETIDKIYEESKKSFKITFDFEFITEDTKTGICDIKEQLTQYAKKHRKPIIIKGKQTLKEFKQAVISDLVNFSELPTGSSYIIFIGIHDAVVKITFLPTNYKSIDYEEYSKEDNKEEDIWTQKKLYIIFVNSLNIV